MIQYVEHKHIDKKKWDACITQCTTPSVYVFSWYLDAVCHNWSALILNDYEAVFPLAKRSKYGIHYLFQPFFTRYFGLFSKTAFTNETVDLFLNTIPTKFKLIEFALHDSATAVSAQFPSKTRQYQQLNLSIGYENVYKNFSENTKRNIKKAIKANFRIDKKISEEMVVDLFRKTKGDELKTFKDKDYKTLINLMNVIGQQKKSELLGVYNEQNELCAAGFFIKNNHQLVYLKGGVSDTGRANGAMHFLFDFFIKEHAAPNYTLDFGGSSVESVARFYKSFGAKDCVYLQLKKNRLSRIAKWLSKKS